MGTYVGSVTKAGTFVRKLAQPHFNEKQKPMNLGS